MRDSDFQYDLLIGRNAIQYPDIELITDMTGSRLVRKYVQTEKCVNFFSDSTDLSVLLSKIEHLDSNIQECIMDIFQKYPSVLHQSGTVKTGELKLRLLRDEVVNYRPYRLAPVEKEKVDEIISDLLAQNIIRESDSPFASPVLLVKKKDGADRMCIDYRALNKILVKDRYPLPLIEDQIDRLGKAKYYISIDMKNGFIKFQFPQNRYNIQPL